ncbi:GDP-6-deoxy-D-mannose reductase [Planctomycetes bacterium Pla163]|uniref:GDP-6-deoxy-D-mannose reductase n=1 Tax=Rohdeia mirabilis TaxID=2528008 RepID=A0A518D097_9BACT|nr:GDP-6-deoxy-D-mannose reductase [Planctomycetes bacterium Pla163]
MARSIDLVTGAGGFAGRALVAHLVAQGRRVVAWRREAVGVALAGVERTVDFDLTDSDRVRAEWGACGAQRVFHLAAVAEPRAARADPERTRAVNVDATRVLLEAVGHAARVLYVSSAAVYAPKAGRLDEDDPTGPVDVYGASKLEAEASVLAAAATGCDVRTVRPFNHSGPGQSTAYALPAFAARLGEVARGERERIEVGALDAVRDYLHVDDVVRAYDHVLDRTDPGSITNVCSGTGTTMRALFEDLARRICGPRADAVVQRALADAELDSPTASSSVGNPYRLATLDFVPLLGLDELLGGLAAAVPR